MRYQITGTDRHTGQMIRMELDAITFESAMQAAVQKGVVVQSCQGVGEMRSNAVGGLLAASQRPVSDDPASLTLIIIGEVCAVISLIVCPILFALSAFVLGIVLIIRGRVGWGIAITAQSVVFGVIGMIFGALVLLAGL